jgi:hypothetical protein
MAISSTQVVTECFQHTEDKAGRASFALAQTVDVYTGCSCERRMSMPLDLRSDAAIAFPTL